MSTATRDIPAYMARIQQGMEGSLLYRSPFGGWEVWNAGAYPINILYNLWGFLLSPIHPDPLAAFHGLRLLAIALLIASVELWLRRQIDPAKRGWARAITYGSLIYLLPLRNYKPDQQLILSLLDTPHSTAAAAGWFTALALAPITSLRVTALATALGWLSALSNPYVAVWFPLSFGVQGLLTGHGRVQHLTAAAATALALVPYLLLMGQPALRGYQTNVEQEPLTELATTAGLLLLAGAGLWVHRDRPEAKVMLALLLIQLLITVPFPYTASRMILGFTPVATIGIVQFLSRRRPFVRWLAAALFTAGSARVVLTIVAAFLLRAPAANQPLPFQPALAYSSEFLEAAAWLRHTAGTVVLTSFETSNVLPLFAGKVVWVGHPQETPDFGQRLRSLQTFWRLEPAQQIQFCKERNIRWVWLGAYEKATLGVEKLPWKPAFSNSEIAIYPCGP